MAGINHERVVVHGDKGTADDWNLDHKQKGHHNCEQFQHLNHVWENRTDWPAGPVVGQVVYRTDYNNFFGWNGTAWQSLTPVATVVVAADGTGNFLTIQEGIDALPATGGVVYIKEGTYIIANRITANKDNITLIGAGHSTIITNSAPTVNLIEVAATTDYFTIENVLLDPSVSLGAVGAVLVFLGATTRARLSNCWFDNWEPQGVVYLGAGEDIVVENCVFETVTGAGPNYAILINGSSYSYIRGNFIYGGVNVYGIQLHLGLIEHISITDNKIYNCNTCISSVGNGLAVHKTNIVGNFLAGFTYGIWINTSWNNVITGNTIETGTAGILIEDNSDFNNIGNNIINDCDFGVYIDAATEHQNSIVSNTLTGNTVAIVDNGTNTEIGHNTT